MKNHRILVVGDIHFPFASRHGLRQLYNFAKAVDPTHIVQIGDLYDFYSFSRFPRSLDIMTPKQEIEQGRSDALQFWLNLKVIAPKAKKHQLLGNHDERVNKQIMAMFPAAESLISPWTMFEFKNVISQESQRDELFIEDLCFMHGYRSRLGDHARHNAMSTITGHSHRGGVVYLRLGDRIIYELNAGYLADDRTGALSYTRQRRISQWTLGCGFIDQYGPRFIPFEDK